jgi:hypothetical protein
MSGNLASATDETADPGFNLEPTGDSQPGFCAHCGKASRLINGFIHRGEVTRAAYLVHWTPGVSEHPPISI